MQLPPTPPVDPDNVEFVIFVRAKKFPQWYPLSVVKGGQAANMLVKAMESELGRKLSGNSLVRNIGTVRHSFPPSWGQHTDRGPWCWCKPFSGHIHPAFVSLLGVMVMLRSSREAF